MTRITTHLNQLKKLTYGKHIVARVEKLLVAGNAAANLQVTLYTIYRNGITSPCTHQDSIVLTVPACQCHKRSIMQTSIIIVIIVIIVIIIITTTTTTIIIIIIIIIIITIITISITPGPIGLHGLSVYMPTANCLQTLVRLLQQSLLCECMDGDQT